MSRRLLLELGRLYYIEAMSYPKYSAERARLLQIASDINRKASGQ